MVINAILVFRSLRFPPEITIPPDQLNKKLPGQLPIYSILCPLYHEAKVLPHFIKSISSLVWPKNKLDVILLLEEDDTETISAAKSLRLPDYCRTLIVPHSQPKTKPKACNYGLAHARGEFVVIYEAEDHPDPDQLKKAYLAFQKSPSSTVCLQAKLNYYNPHQNFLTRLFTAEYSLWFDVALPGLQTINTSIPLGGTSNHFRTGVLRHIHGWDSFNVTEDCDLGTRLFKSGYKTAIIDSVTLEEANSHLGNWLRQRSRWIKGYLQTFLVHNRHPLRFLKDHGLHGLLFQLNTGGKIAFMIINPILWATTISYFAFYPIVGPTIEALYPPLVLYLAASSFIFGNFLYLYYYMIGCARRGHWELIKYVFLIPFYWLFISIAAFKAVFQLVFRPHYWEKTHHGLHISPSRIWNLKTEGLLLIASTMVSNFLNFLYNVYLGRHLSAENFSLIGLMGSFLYLVQIPGSALAKTVSHQSAYLGGQMRAETHKFWRFVRGRSTLIFFVLSILWVAASPLLTRTFKTDSIWPLVIFSPVWLTAVLSSVDRGLLSGHHRFGTLAFLSLTEAVIKFASAVILVSINQPQYVYASFPLTSILSFAIIWLVARPKTPEPSVPLLDYSPERFPWKFFSTSITSRMSTLAFLSLDVIFAKMYLPPEVAGQYVLISLAGKIVYFLGSLFDPFIIPVVSRSQGEGRNSRQPFYQLFLGNAACSLIGFMALGPLGNTFAPLLFGEKIVPLIPYLTVFSLAMVNFTLGGSVVSYHLARREFAFPIMALFVSLAQPILFYFFHGSLWSLVHIMLWLSVAYALTLFFMHLLVHYYVPISGNLNDLLGLFTRLFFPRRPLPVNKLRILVFNWRDICHKWSGGAEIYVHELAKNWVKAGHQVTVFCGNDSKCLTHERMDGVEVIRHGGFFMVYVWAAIYYLLKLRGRFDLVIDSENGVPFFTPLFVGVPKILLIHHIHQEVFRRQLSFPMAQIALFLESKIMPLVYSGQKIITVSESSKTDILKVCRCRPENISVITPGIDPTQFVRVSPKTHHPSFLYLGRIRPYKNLDIAIKAFAEVVKTYPKARLNIAGGGEGIKQLRELVERLKLSRHVYLLGAVSEKEKVQLLSESWAMLQPSSFEGWGITVIEANACATPVIASDVVGLRDSVVHQETGILVPPRDPQALASAIKYLIRHPARLRTFSQNALAWSVNFNWKDQSRKFLDAAVNHLAIKYSYPVTSQPALAEQRV